jgi:hypothetical protein
VVLSVADARQYHAVLQKILFVQSQGAVSGFDDAELILVVVDAEAAGKAGADAGEGVAVAAQETNAKRMKSRDVGRGFEVSVFEQGRHPLAHFTSGLVRESYCQDSGRRHPSRSDNVRDAMRNDARLTTSCAGQN